MFVLRKPFKTYEMAEGVRVRSKKKSAVAYATCKLHAGTPGIRINGRPPSLVEPKPLVGKFLETINLIGDGLLSNYMIQIVVQGGGAVSQIYAARQALARSVLAYLQKFVDEETKMELEQRLLAYDLHLLIKDSRVREPKKFGGKGARARYQKSYR